ncbi:unnamed protein product [Schistocephalus solidus]|uniref:Uncharacterized protein n=1 Tax=Schistocephalus solidus TaxID=70667 RepID=A0A183SVM2_SCHSO|nr:unnamed protein product [Schistocephalus solidus]
MRYVSDWIVGRPIVVYYLGSVLCSGLGAASPSAPSSSIRANGLARGSVLPLFLETIAGRTCYFYDNRSGRSLLVGTRAQLTGIPAKPADCQCLNPGLFLQTVNTTSCNLRHLILPPGHQPTASLPLGLCIDDVRCALLGAHLLTTFDLLVDCRQPSSREQTTKLISGYSFR